MASPKELIAAIAEQTGVPEGTVIQHDRNLSLAGLRSVGGRGRAVARVTFQDAANLLIAVAASRNVKDSVKTVEEYAALVSDSPMRFGDERHVKTFGEALAALLEAVSAKPEIYSGKGADVRVTLGGPRPRAFIEHATPEGAVVPFEYHQRDRHKPLPCYGDLEHTSRFTQATLSHVGAVVGRDG